MDLKNVSTMELKLLYSSSSDFDGLCHAQLAVNLPNDVALQTSNDLAFAFPIFCTFLDISSDLVFAGSNHGYAVLAHPLTGS
jgi:hypothetical protein